MIISLISYKGFAMKKIVLVIVVLIVLGSLVACSGEIPPTDSGGPATEKPYRPTLSPTPDWLVRWLNEPVCQPPCCENITPGKTSFADALAIANTISGVKVSYVGDDNIRLKSNQYSAYNFAVLQSRGDANIQEIDLTTKYTLLELGEIVDLYGFPDEMIKFRSSGDQLATHWIDLLYYDLGMVITFDPLPGDPWNKVSLEPNTYIGTIRFYASQLEYYFNAPQWLGAIVSPAIKLNGYGNYDIPEGRLLP
jgi:hypothetical protein